MPDRPLLSDHFSLDEIRELSEDLFAQAVAQGMHAPFALNCDEWGRTYAERLADALITSAASDENEESA